MSQTVDRARLRTVHLVPLTAMNSEGRLNLELQAQHTQRMYAAGVRVFLPAAGTSEFHSLLADEIVDIIRTTREASGSDALIFAPVGLQLDHALTVGRDSLAAGADGIMFMPFAHPYVSDEGCFNYFRRVMGELRCPSLIYRKAGVPTDALLLKLSADPRVVGFKYAVNQMHEFHTTLLADRGRSEWLCGSAERFAPFFMLAGAGGYTSGAGNLCPHLTLAMHSALAAGEYAEGLRLQRILLPIEDYRARQGDSYNISMLKFGMSLLGLDFGKARPPQRELTLDEQDEIRELLEPILEFESGLANEMQKAGLSSKAEP